MSRAYQIPDFPNYYVTDTGDVYSTNYRRMGSNKKLAPETCKTGYKRVSLLKDGHATRRYIHRLVAEAFIPNPDGKPQVNHKNGNKADNRIENLEWATHVENARHAFQILGIRSVPFVKRVFPQPKPVLQFKDGVLVAEFKSTCEASRMTGVPQSLIVDNCNKKRLKGCGFQWIYK